MPGIPPLAGAHLRSLQSCPARGGGGVGGVGVGEWGGGEGRVRVSLSMPGEQPPIARVTTLHLLTPLTCGQRGWGGAPGRPPPSPSRMLFPPQSGARDYTRTPTRQTRTLNSLKLLPMKIRSVSSHSLARAED